MTAEQPAPTRPGVRHDGLWGHRDFLKLWLGESVSLVGTWATTLVFPLVALSRLRASPTELGLVSAAQLAPVLVITPVAGHWCDRVRRRNLLIVANLARMVTLGAGIALVETGGLRIWNWCLVAFVLGAFTAVFDVAWHSYLPAVLTADQLVVGNARMQTSYSVSQLAGSGFGGWMLKVLSPAIAFAADIASYAVATASLLMIRTREAPPQPSGGTGGGRRGLARGFRLLWGDRVLRALLVEGAWFNFCEQSLLTIFLVYAVRSIGLDPGQVGLCVGLGSVGAFVGSLIADRLARPWGVARTLVVAIGVASLSPALILLAPHGRAAAVAVIVLSFNLYALGLSVFNVYNVSQRQLRTPPAALGRVTAAFGTVAFGALPLGAATGGGAAQLLGLRPALIAVVAVFIAGWLVFARAVRRWPDDAVNGTEPARPALADAAG